MLYGHEAGLNNMPSNGYMQLHAVKCSPNPLGGSNAFVTYQPNAHSTSRSLTTPPTAPLLPVLQGAGDFGAGQG